MKIKMILDWCPEDPDSPKAGDILNVKDTDNEEMCWYVIWGDEEISVYFYEAEQL